MFCSILQCIVIQAREAISTVADLAPQSAVLMDGQRVAVEDVSIGTLLAVKAGELIPIDGLVDSGKSSIDESNVTGESKPVEKTDGGLVWAGTMNLSGILLTSAITSGCFLESTRHITSLTPGNCLCRLYNHEDHGLG